jgi:hypothetical protein
VETASAGDWSTLTLSTVAVRPTDDVDDITVVPISSSSDGDYCTVWKRFDGEIWDRDFDAPDSDVGATQVLEVDLAAYGLGEITVIPVAPVPV